MNASWLPPLYLSIQSAAAWPENVHPLTSLHSAIWEFQEAAQKSTFSDLDLTKKVHLISCQKMVQYSSAFGWILKNISALINKIAIGRFISAGELGLEVLSPVMVELTVKEAERVKPAKTKMVDTLQSIWTDASNQKLFIDPLASLVGSANITAWKEVEPGKKYVINQKEAVQGIWNQSGPVPVSVSIPKNLAIKFSEQEGGKTITLPRGAVKFSYQTSRLVPSLFRPFIPDITGTINSLTTLDYQVHVNYTVAGLTRTTSLSLHEFEKQFGKAVWTPDPLQTIPEAGAIWPKDQMDATLNEIWPDVNQNHFIREYWTQLLQGADIVSWKKEGDFYTLQVAKENRVTPKPLKMGSEMITIPLYFVLNKNIKMKIAKDEQYPTLHSFTFPHGGISTVIDVNEMRTFFSKVSDFIKTGTEEEKRAFLEDLNKFIQATEKKEQITEQVLKDHSWKASLALNGLAFLFKKIICPVEKILIATTELAVLCSSPTKLFNPSRMMELDKALNILKGFQAA